MSEFQSALEEHLEVARGLAELEPAVQALAADVHTSLRRGGKLLLLGNGGSAADAQHLAAELVGRYRRERAALAALALTTDTSALTAIGNDYGYEHVFARQVEALATERDVVLGLSTSGDSENVLRALQRAAALGACTWGMTGRSGGAMAELLGRRILRVPSANTPRIQECHIFLGHMLCALVERSVCEDAG